MNNNNFDQLFNPGGIGGIELKNRIIMPPMGTQLASLDGYITARQKDYYEERAKGGVALIIVECACVEYPRGRAQSNQVSISDDKYLLGLSELASVIKKHGAVPAIQICHAGRASSAAIAGSKPIAPSAIALAGRETPHKLSISEIARLVELFAQAVLRARKAGFEGVEIHGAHHYIIAQFLSSATNKRRDDYGGSLKNRARFLLEIIRESRRLVGREYPFWVRLNGAEYGIENGTNIEEAKKVACWAEEACVDAVHVSAWGEGPEFFKYGIVPMTEPEGLLLPLVEQIKQAVRIPVIAAGRISPHLGEKVLQERKADFISIGRNLITDPELPNKLASDEQEEIRPCLRCNYCNDCRILDQGIRCQVNAAVGREREFIIAPADKKKKVVVIGGGPAGMEATRVTRLRGHDVILIEKQPRLGGQLLLASVPPYKSTISDFNDYLIRQVKKLGTNIRLQTEATTELLEQIDPDVVIIATGVILYIPPIPGIETSKFVTAAEILQGTEVGTRIVIIGGESVGCEVAEYLATKGKKVTICEVAEYISDSGKVVKRGTFAESTPVSLRGRLLDRLVKLGVVMMGGVKYEKMGEKTLTVINAAGERETLNADTIVLATGTRPSLKLYQQLAGKYKTFLIGDCVRSGRIVNAIDDANRVAVII